MNNKSLKSILVLIVSAALFSTAAWADSIPDPATAQKKAIDHMHHKLHDDQAAFKASEAKALKELNEMTVREGVDMGDINAKIDELWPPKHRLCDFVMATWWKCGPYSPTNKR